MTVPSGVFTILGSPITSSGTLQVGLVNQLANTVWAGPTSGAESVPTFRLLVSDDIPNLSASKITSGTLGVDRGGTGATTLTGVLFGNGTSAFTGIASTTANQMLRVNSAGTGYEWFTPDYLSNVMTSLGDMIYGNAVGLPVRRSGNVTTTKMFLSQTGDGTSSAAPQWSVVTASDVGGVPTSRQLTINGTAYDLSADRTWSVGTVTSVALTMPSAFSVANSPVTSSGTLAVTATGDTTQYIAGDGSLVAFPITGQAGTLVREVRNNTGATLTKGTVVYINGALGNKPTVAKALATSDATSAQTFGLIQADIPNNSNGYLVAFGDLDGLDTSAFTEGVQLYLSATTAGGYTITKQYAPNHLVYIGVVTRSHPTQGRIEVRIQNGYELDEIHDVSAQTPSNNDGLFYNSTNSLWENKSIATALGFTPVTSARTLTINDVAFDLSANRSWSVGDYGTW
jgi:hypothetical protein